MSLSMKRSGYPFCRNTLRNKWSSSFIVSSVQSFYALLARQRIRFHFTVIRAKLLRWTYQIFIFHVAFLFTDNCAEPPTGRLTRTPKHAILSFYCFSSMRWTFQWALLKVRAVRAISVLSYTTERYRKGLIVQWMAVTGYFQFSPRRHRRIGVPEVIQFSPRHFDGKTLRCILTRHFVCMCKGAYNVHPREHISRRCFKEWICSNN